MSKKYEVLGHVSMFLCEVTQLKAERAILYGIANKSHDVNRRAIYTNYSSIEEFNYNYNKGHNSNKHKKVDCWECGIEVKTIDPTKRTYCKDCKEDKRIRDIEVNVEYTRMRTMLMFERALGLLEKQNKLIQVEHYKEVADVLQVYVIDNPGKFGSSHEMLVAMQMLKDKVHISIQTIVANKTVDFILKEDHVVLEIDGYLHEHSKLQDFKADILIRDELGNDWEVIRIPTKYIETNITMLYEAIMQLKLYRQQLRKDNNGIIPEYYSKREQKVLQGLI